MNSRTVLCHAFMVGAALASLGADAPKTVVELTPAGADNGLRQVPTSNSGIQLVQHQTQSTRHSVSTAYQQQKRSTPRGRIRQTQHTPQSAQPTPIPEKPKKKGLFRRFIDRFSFGGDDEGEAAVSPGPPGPAIPSPPPITNGKGRSVQARSTGYQQQNSPPAVPGVGTQPQNQGAQPLVPGVQQQRQQQQYHTPRLRQQGEGYSPGMQNRQQRAVPRDDGFINPFEGQGLAQDDALLDLDSLIEGETTTNVTSVNVIPSDPEPEQFEIVPELNIEESNADPVVVSREKPRGKAEGPFTGYRLESDEEVLGFDEPVATVVPPRQTDSADSTEVATVSVTSAIPEDVSTTPDLKEPAMQLPPVDPREEVQIAVQSPATARDSEIEKIPLLDEQDVNPFEQAAEEEKEETVVVQSEPVGFSREAMAPADPNSVSVMDQKSRREQQRFRIMSRTGKTGFKGFCPVELRDRRELVDSRPNYTAKFGLQTYSFSSPEAKSAFEANPSRYAPAAGGSDVVLLVNTGEDLTGALDFSLWYRDRLYMFRSRETQQMFSRDPGRYANQY